MNQIVKTKVKNARDALSDKNWEKAKIAASDALEFDPENYNANVFLGFALLELGDIQASEQAYLKATQANAEQPLAWQGLSKLYLQAGYEEKYGNTLHKLALLFAKKGDATKCAESLQSLLELHRKQGNQLQVADTLGLFLPESLFYSTLLDLPPPDATNPESTTTFFAQSTIQNSLPIVEEIVSIYEQNETNNYNKEVENRRTRLGSLPLDEEKKSVVREIFSVSKIPGLYREIINHPNTSDELRRETEAKLLEHRWRLLLALPTSAQFLEQKTSLIKEVDDMVNGMILLGVRNELAWSIFIEGKDAEIIADYDYKVLLQFISLFPDSKLAQLLAAYLAYDGISRADIDGIEASGEEKTQPVVPGDEDYGANVTDLFHEVQDSIIAHRCTGEIYRRDRDYEDTIKVAEDGLTLLRRQEAERGIQLHAVRRSFNVLLGVSLVHFFPPKHHVRALRIIDGILQEDGNNVQCLMGRGYIMQAARKWEDAARAFQQVASLLPNDLHEGLRAQEEDAWCKIQTSDAETGEKIMRQVADILDNEEGRKEDSARAWWRSGQAQVILGEPERAYRCFITSLQRSPSYAPSFTSLGVYYQEVANPPDPARASKCFQKAFELDPRETEAARRLALGFAEEREWDLVEVVARRTIDGEGGSDAAASSRYQSLNSWAWKAIGVVELNRQRYDPASQAFQIALRTEPEDSSLWLRLGEAYSKAGRFAAAVKALERARELEPEDWISSYFLGEVRRQMGQFQEAIDMFVAILERTPSELRVLLSLAQSYLESGRAQLAAGFSARAESSFVASVRVTLRSIDSTPGFRRIAWKVSADALYELSRLATLTHSDEVLKTIDDVLRLLADYSSSRLSTFMPFPVTLSDDDPYAMGKFASQVALLAYDYRITLGSLDDTASASAYYDLGIALCSYARTGGKTQHAAQKNAGICLKEALKLDPYNQRYWNTFGNALFVEQPKTAQHAYIRALEIDSKNVCTWTNLGFLYLYHSDIELANEAFYKAQVLDPDFAAAWVGQGLVAVLNDHQREALALFEHATTLAVPVPAADMEFAKRLFDRVSTLQRRDDVNPEAFSPAFFVLDRFRKQHPADATAQHLFGLICERLGHLDLAAEVVGRVITLLEAAYEESEDPEIERHFAIAHANMARLRLMRGDCEGALESSQVVLGLLGDTAGAEEGNLLLAQVQLWSGLASFRLGQLDTALQSLESAFETAASSDKDEIKRHIAVVTAQVLWSIGTQEGQEAAKSRLLQSIEIDPDNLAAVNTLAAMGILTEDDGLVDAALSEILALPLDQRRSRDPQRDVTYLLVQHYLSQGDNNRALSVSEKAVLAEPIAWQTRHQLASLQLQRHDPASALALLRSSASSEDIQILRETLPLIAVVEAQIDPAAAQKVASKAAMLTPWDRTVWRALAYTRSCVAA